MLRVLNIYRYLPIKDLDFDNNIVYKLYYDLKRSYGINSLFIKTLIYVPKELVYFKRSLKNRYNIINKLYYYDTVFNCKVLFYQCMLPLINKFFLESFFIIKVEHQIFKKRIQKIVSIYNPDIIHAHNIFPDAYIAYKIYKKYNVPYILTIRGKYNPFYNRNFVKEILKNSSGITTPSFMLYSRLKENYKMELIPHGLDDFWYHSKKREFDENCIRIVTTCRLLEMKNIQTVLHTVAILKKEGRRIEYNIIGDGPYLEELKKLTNQLNISNEVLFHGWQNVENQVKVYSKCNIFVMLSSPETFGRVYFEAAAQRLLIIGVKGVGAYGHFTENEALFIEINSIQLSKELNRIDKSLFDKLTENSYSKVCEMREENITDRYYKILKTIKNNSGQ